MSAATPMESEARAETSEPPRSWHDVYNPGHDAAGWSVPGAGVERFYELEHPEPHRSRARQLLHDHPEIKQLFGRNRWSAALVVGIVAVQFGLAWVLRGGPWWAILLVAWLVGAFANHALWVLIHEATHNLVFKRKWLNQLTGMICNLPMGVPSAESFRIYHLKHHQYQGDYQLDADLPSEWEAKLFDRLPAGKLLWELVFPLVQSLRTIRFAHSKRISFWRGGVIANFLLQVGFDVAVVVFVGPAALGYFLASLIFSIGPHPLGARWVQEHYIVRPGQETYSYYGPLNAVALNVGYHNEHHDFPFVPWHRLPALRRTAPEAYDTLHSHRSWTRLWLRFLTDRSITLHSRATRDGDINRRRRQRPRDTYARETLDEQAGQAAA